MKSKYWYFDNREVWLIWIPTTLMWAVYWKYLFNISLWYYLVSLLVTIIWIMIFHKPTGAKMGFDLPSILAALISTIIFSIVALLIVIGGREGAMYWVLLGG